MKKLRVLLLIMLSILLLAACNDDNEEVVEEEERIVPVEVAEVKTGNITNVQTLYGRTAPQKTTPILAEMPGVVESVEVQNGDIVEKDDLLATVRTAAGLIRITASTDGEITKFQIEEDDLISPEEPIGFIIDTKEMDITLQVTSAVRALFSEEDTYDVTIEGTTYKAVVSVVNVLPNEAGLYDIELRIENEDGDIIAGMVVGVDVEQTLVTEALIVPTEAVIEESEGAYVYVVTDDEVERVEIDIVEMQTNETAIEGVQADDQVVVNGQLTLSDGNKVEVVKVVNES